jgi:hypothetical protein
MANLFAYVHLDHAGIEGDKLTIGDARGQTWTYELTHEEGRRSDLSAVWVEIGETPTETGNNLFKKMRGWLAISAKIGHQNQGGFIVFTQDHAGDVPDIETVGTTFRVAKQWVVEPGEPGEHSSI